MFGSGNLESGIKKLDVRDMIFQLEPDEAPFVSILSKVSKAKAVDMQINWFEDAQLANYTQINLVAGYADTDVTFIVDDASIFQVNDIVKNTRTGEVMRVTGFNDTAKTITVSRAWGTTVAAAILDNDYMYRLGSAMAEGWTAPDSLVTAKSKKSNYLQIFSKTVTITETADAIDVFGGNRRNYERNKVGRELKREIESQLLFGEPKEDTTGSQKRWQTGGIHYFISASAPTLDLNGAAMTESAWEGWLKDLFTYGSNTKLFFCGNLLLSQISQFASAKQRVEPGDIKTYGVSFRRYHSANGDVDLIKDAHFRGPWAGNGLALDINDVVYRYLQGQDIALKTNIQAKADHFIQDEYSGTLGLEIHNAEKHGIVEDAA